MRSRDIATKLTLNKAIEGRLERRDLTLPSGNGGISRRFGRAPRVLLAYFRGWGSPRSGIPFLQ